MALGNPLSPLPVICTLAQEVTLGTRMADRGVVPDLPRGSFSEVRKGQTLQFVQHELSVLTTSSRVFLPPHTMSLHLWVLGSLSPVGLNRCGS